MELRLIRDDDATELLSLIEANRLYLKEWLTWVDGMSSLPSAKGYIVSRVAGAEEQKALCFVIRSDRKIVGLSHLVDIDLINRKASIGYWVGAQYRGMGIAKRATRFLISHAFGDLALNRVEIRCASGNTASRAIPLALGFKEEGILRAGEWLRDRFVDQVVYGLLRDEWHLQQPKLGFDPLS